MFFYWVTLNTIQLGLFTCIKKLNASHLNIVHGTKNKNIISEETIKSVLTEEDSGNIHEKIRL